MSPAAIGYRNGNFELSGFSQISDDGGTLFDVVGELDTGFDRVDDCTDDRRRELSRQIVAGELYELRAAEVACLFNVPQSAVYHHWVRDGFLRAFTVTRSSQVFSVAELISFLERHPTMFAPADLLPPFDVAYRRAHGDREWTSTTVIARRLGVTPRTVQQYCKDGRIPARHVGRGWYLIPTDAPLPVIKPHPQRKRR